MSNSKPIYDLEERKQRNSDCRCSAYFTRLILETNSTEFEKEGFELHDEAVQLTKIFSTIIEKSK